MQLIFFTLAFTALFLFIVSLLRNQGHTPLFPWMTTLVPWVPNSIAGTPVCIE